MAYRHGASKPLLFRYAARLLLPAQVDCGGGAPGAGTHSSGRYGGCMALAAIVTQCTSIFAVQPFS